MPPDGSIAMAAYLEVLQSALTRWGALMIFGALFLECVPVVGFAVPGLTILVVAGFLAAGQPLLEAALFFVAAFAGVASSDTLAYLTGRLGGERIGPVRRLILRHDTFRREISGQSLPVLLLYQFPPYSRMFAPLLMGALSFAWTRWLLIVTVGTLAFAAAFYGLGFAVGLAGRELFGAVSTASTLSALFLLGLLVWAAYLGVRLYRLRRRPTERAL